MDIQFSEIMTAPKVRTTGQFQVINVDANTTNVRIERMNINDNNGWAVIDCYSKRNRTVVIAENITLAHAKMVAESYLLTNA